ncbi:MAG: DUF4442 domain-containing protein [Ardenticatenaceae bacterium]
MIVKLYRRLLNYPRLNQILTNLYPALFFTGIRITQIASDWKTIRVRMGGLFSMTPMGAQFGGALFTMCDPWFMMILVRHFGREFKIWDKAATIHFLRRGRGTMYATFSVSDEQLAFIRERVSAESKINIVFTTQILDREEQVVAEVEKTISVRLRTPSLLHADQPANTYRFDEKQREVGFYA